MTAAQCQLDFNPYPENIFTPGTMNYRLYERLKQGPILLSELHRELGMDTARIRDVRNLLLKKHGFNIVCKIIEQGETEYRIYG
jgi:hypothetical protein